MAPRGPYVTAQSFGVDPQFSLSLPCGDPPAVRGHPRQVEQNTYSECARLDSHPPRRLPHQGAKGRRWREPATVIKMQSQVSRSGSVTAVNNREASMPLNAASPRAPRHSVGKEHPDPSKALIILPQKEPSLQRSYQSRANRQGRLYFGRGIAQQDLTNPCAPRLLRQLGLSLVPICLVDRLLP
jgi:hypothetical protein